MIYLYSGTPGSGKSLNSARMIINRAKSGKPTIGNFEVNLSAYEKADYTYVENYYLTPEYLEEYSKSYFDGKPVREGAIVLLIDECQLLFNAREWQKSGRADWLKFFTQHRKYGYDIYLIAQFDRMVDRQIRSLIEYEYTHRKLANFGIQGKIMSLVFGGETFCVVKRWYPLKEKIGVEFFHCRKKLYSIYDSYGTFTLDKSIKDDCSPAAQRVWVSAELLEGQTSLLDSSHT